MSIQTLLRRGAVAACLVACAVPCPAQEPVTLKGHTEAVWTAVFSPDGTTLATAGFDRVVRLWDVAEGRRKASLGEHDEYVLAAAFSPDGDLLATADSAGRIKVWNVADGELSVTLDGHLAPVGSLAFAPDGATLASGSLDRTVKLWEVAGGKLQKELAAGERVREVAFSAEGETLLSADAKGVVKRWDVASGEAEAVLDAKTGLEAALALSPDGWRFAASALGPSVRAFSVEDREEIGVLELAKPTGDALLSIAFSADADTVAAGGFDGSVAIWNLETQKLVQVLKGHSGYVAALAFSPDGALLASGGADGTVRLWRLTQVTEDEAPAEDAEGEEGSDDE